MARNKRIRPTSATDIEEMLGFADSFLANLKSIEETAIAKGREESKNGVGMGTPASVSRDPKVARAFLVQLFGFISAIRSSKEYIHSAVANSPGEGSVRDGHLKESIVAFHVFLANQVLHQNLISTARSFYIGGERSGDFSFAYSEAAMTQDAATLFREIQEKRHAETGTKYSILEFADLVVSRLRSIHSDCVAARYY